MKPRLWPPLVTGLLLAMLRAGAAQADTCSPGSHSELVAPGVTYYDCKDKDPSVHVVTIDRTLRGMHLQVLAEPYPLENVGPMLVLRKVDELAKANEAVVAINGFYWGPEIAQGRACNLFAGSLDCLGVPTTTVFLDGRRFSKPKQGTAEVLMGFTVDGSGIQAKRISPNELSEPENQPYRQWLYGSEKTVMAGFAFNPKGGDTPKTNLSIIGYSTSHIIFLVTQKEYRLSELENTLSAFDVSDAVLNDGGGSAELSVLNKQLIDPTKEARYVAYAIGLVPGYPNGASSDPQGPGSANAAEEHMKEDAAAQVPGSPNAEEEHMKEDAPAQKPAPQPKPAPRRSGVKFK